MARILHKGLSDSVLSAVFKVYNYLGPGLLESVYEGAMVIELKKRRLDIRRQVAYPLLYEGEMAGARAGEIDGCDFIAYVPVIPWILSEQSRGFLQAMVQVALRDYFRKKYNPRKLIVSPNLKTTPSI